MKSIAQQLTSWLFGEREFVCHFCKIIVVAAFLWSLQCSYQAHWTGPDGYNELRNISFDGRISEPQWVPPGKVTFIGGGPIRSATLEVSGTPTVKMHSREDFAAVSSAAEETLAGFTADLWVRYAARKGSVWFTYSEPAKLPDHPHRFLSANKETLRHEGGLVISAEQQRDGLTLSIHETIQSVWAFVIALLLALVSAVTVGTAETLLRAFAKHRRASTETSAA